MQNCLPVDFFVFDCSQVRIPHHSGNKVGSGFEMDSPSVESTIFYFFNRMAKRHPNHFGGKVHVDKIFIFPVFDRLILKIVVRSDAEAIATCPTVTVLDGGGGQWCTFRWLVFALSRAWRRCWGVSANYIFCLDFLLVADPVAALRRVSPIARAFGRHAFFLTWQRVYL